MNFFALVGKRGAETIKLIDLNHQAQNELTQRLEPHMVQVIGGDHVDFQSGYKADEDEILRIRDYAFPAALHALTVVDEVADLQTLDAEEIEQAEVRGLAAVEWSANNRATVGFQRIEQRYLLKRESFRMLLAQGRFVRDDRVGLEIEDRIDAVYHRGTLYVSSWPRTNSILDLSAYLREATIAEAQTFVRHRRLTTPDGFDLSHLADSVVRRKIAAVTDSGILNRVTPQVLKRYAKRAGVALNVTDGKIVLPSDKRGFKEVLAFLNEDYVVFEATAEYWLTNSKRPVGR